MMLHCDLFRLAMVGIGLMLIGLVGGCSMSSPEDLNAARGRLFRVDLEQSRAELLKETVFDPRTDEGRSRHTIYWSPSTRLIQVKRQNNFAGLHGTYLAHIRDLTEADAKAAAAGERFVCLYVTLLAEGEAGAGWVVDERNLLVNFEPDPQSANHRGGTVTIDGRSVPMQLRGPRAEVDIRSLVTADVLAEGLWEAQLFGAHDKKGRFIADRMELYPQVDPRTTDDPSLPRVLVIGDSISVNYHEAAKAALAGIANYHRVEGNAGPSDRGVICTELWLGDYTLPGLGWDVIQFNHGLHDLKQYYDEQTQTYGEYQIPIDTYKANLEKQIAILKKTGATLVWCSTTPVPQSSVGRWGEHVMGRKHGADLIFNQAALEVLAHHPDILINDLNTAIRQSAGFEAWWQGSDVHFWQAEQQQIVGQAVAEAIKQALSARKAR